MQDSIDRYMVRVRCFFSSQITIDILQIMALDANDAEYSTTSKRHNLQFSDKHLFRNKTCHETLDQRTTTATVYLRYECPGAPLWSNILIGPFTAFLASHWWTVSHVSRSLPQEFPQTQILNKRERRHGWTILKTCFPFYNFVNFLVINFCIVILKFYRKAPVEVGHML